MDPKPIFRLRNILLLGLLAAGIFGAGFEHGRRAPPFDRALMPRGPAAYAPRPGHILPLPIDL
jgi:hypothetical protein